MFPSPSERDGRERSFNILKLTKELKVLFRRVLMKVFLGIILSTTKLISVVVYIAMEKLVINDDLYISPPTDADKAALVKYLNDEDIYKHTLRIPHPYTQKDADDFLNQCREMRKQYGRNLSWMVRRNNGEVIGGIGFHLNYGIDSHRDELYYWMAKPYWGHGIMTKALKRFCEYGFSYVGLIRIEAIVFENNKASERILEKNGFKHEGVMKKIYEKKGHYIDGRMYALVK